MTQLIDLSRRIDAASAALGRAAAWLVLLACLTATGTALIGRLLGSGSNAWFEAQWLMFAAIFLLAAPWTLSLNQHVRIDIVSHRLPPRMRDWIDVIGHALFLLPVSAIVVATSVPFAAASLAQREGSSNFGGLPQWPLKMMIPFAFAWLFVQGLSELIKRIAILRGDLPAPPAGVALPPQNEA